MSFIVFDLETTGLDPKWNLPLQAAMIHTDSDLNTLDELSMRCRLPAHVVPSPKALLVTGLRPEQLEQAPLSSTELLATIAKMLSHWAPATVIGYNTLAYDEEILRHGFFTHLLPAYATQAPGMRRADLLTMARAVAMLEPEAISVPMNAAGKPSFRLGDICRANNIALSEAEAHDALADARATLALFRHLKTAAPGTTAMMLENSHKTGPIGRLAAGDPLLLGGLQKLTPVVGLTANPNVATSWAAIDLTIDPADYLDLGYDEIAKLLLGRSSRPVRTVKTNAQPILVPFASGCHALAEDQRDEALYHERAARIRQHEGFRQHVATALANRFADREPSPHHEETLYAGGFLSNADTRLSARWHAASWTDRPAIAAQFVDERLKAFANRLTWLEAPEVLSPAARQKGQEWLRDRLGTQAQVPWLTVSAALDEIARLRDELVPANTGPLEHLDAIERWLRERGMARQVAA